MVQREYHAVYSAEADMTFIIEDTFVSENGEFSELVTTAVTGFYFGEPNEENTRLYRHRPIAKAW